MAGCIGIGAKASAGRKPCPRGKLYGVKAAGRGLLDAAMLDSELAREAESSTAGKHPWSVDCE